MPWRLTRDNHAQATPTDSWPLQKRPIHRRARFSGVPPDESSHFCQSVLRNNHRHVFWRCQQTIYHALTISSLTTYDKLKIPFTIFQEKFNASWSFVVSLILWPNFTAKVTYCTFHLWFSNTLRLRGMGTQPMGTILKFASVPLRKIGTLLLGSWWLWQCFLPTLYCIDSRPNLELASGNCES